MKKALIISTVSGFVPQFEMNNVTILQSMGYEIHYASNYHYPSYGNDNKRLEGTGIVQHQIDFVRSPFKKENICIYRQLKKLMKKECFELVHCHTPMGGILGRLAARSAKIGTVIYTVHGFHFYKGAPFRNWLLYYPAERLLSRLTKQLICINKEDFSKARNFASPYVDYIPGVGIDLDKVRVQEQLVLEGKREALGLDKKRKILLSTGELIKRKNHETVIKAMANMKSFLKDEEMPIYLICGHGALEGYLKELVKKLKIKKYVKFLGYRDDIFQIYRIADIYIFPSYQEGLPMALLEAMASGCPVVCSKIRGNVDLLEDGEGAILIDKADDAECYAREIAALLKDEKRMRVMGEDNQEHAKEFDIKRVGEKMKMIYGRLMDA